MLSQINLAFFGVSLTTNSTGFASFSFKIPGDFNGLDGYIELNNGRYLEYAELWTDDSGENGDIIQNMCLKDVDGIIPLSARSQFPNYPVIGYFYDNQISGSGINQGLFLKPGEKLTVGSISGLPIFAPSGLYIYGEFQSASATPNRTIRANIYWGILQP